MISQFCAPELPILRKFDYHFQHLHKSADMIDGYVGEAEGLGLSHATAGNLGYDINQFAAHLSNVFFRPSTQH